MGGEFGQPIGPEYWQSSCIARRGRAMMLVVIVVLVALWFLGVLTKATLGGLLHILLVVAIVIGLVNFIGRRV
jgi:hypothetical protein